MQPEQLIQFQRDFALALAAEARGPMAVYRNTVIHGAVEALRANYPVTEQILGSEMFEHVAVDFASTCPPRSPVLAFYGEEFGDWLAHQPWIADLPYLPDVARVERLHVCCLFAPDAEPIAKQLARESYLISGRKLGLHPALHFTWVSTPAMSIWLAHQQPNPGEIAPDWKPEGALFSRPTPFVIHTPRLGPAAHRMLCGIRIGETVSASIAAAAHLYPQEDCTAVFASLANLGAFVAPSLERTN